LNRHARVRCCGSTLARLMTRFCGYAHAIKVTRLTCAFLCCSTKDRRFARVMGSIRVHSLQEHRAKSARGAALKCTVFPGATTKHAMISWLRRIYEFVHAGNFLEERESLRSRARWRRGDSCLASLTMCLVTGSISFGIRIHEPRICNFAVS
jgi:hypothetical protein